MNGERKDFLSVTPPASPDMRETGIRAKQSQAPAGETAFIDEKELLNRLPVCRRTLTSWRKRGRIPFVKLPGSRRVLYHWQSIEAALLRMQQNGV